MIINNIQTNEKANKIIKTISRRLKEKIDELEFVYLVGGPKEAWVQAEATLAFYDECWPIVWERKVNKWKVLRSNKNIKSEKVCEITNEKMISDVRADIVITDKKFIKTCLVDKEKADLYKKCFNETGFHYIELKFDEIDSVKIGSSDHPKKKDAWRKFLEKNLWSDFRKLKKRKTEGQLLRCSSIIAICVVRIYGSKKYTENEILGYLDNRKSKKTKKMNPHIPNSKVIKIGNDSDVQFFIISYYQ